jgi:hypothetical protein
VAKAEQAAAAVAACKEFFPSQGYLILVAVVAVCRQLAYSKLAMAVVE